MNNDTLVGPRTLVFGALLVLVGSATGLLAQSEQERRPGDRASIGRASIGRASIVKWHRQVHLGGSQAQAARQKLVQHSAEAAPYLIEKLKEAGADRDGLRYLMGYLSEEAIPSFCREASRLDSPVRAEVLALLVRFGSIHGGPPRELVDVALAGMQSEDPRILKPVFELLGHMRSVAELHMVDAAPLGPRFALALTGEPRPPLFALREAARDPNAFVRGLAAAGVAARSEAGAGAALAELVLDEDAVVRGIAWEAIARRLARDPADNADLVPLLSQRLSRRIGGHVRATYDELGERTNLVTLLVPAGEAALPLFLDVLELPVSPEFWVAVETDKVREQALLGLQAIGAGAAAAIPALKAGLDGDAMPLQLRVLALQILRALELPKDEESRLCWQAYQHALAAKPYEGASEGYVSYFRTKRVALVQTALAGLAVAGDASVLAEIEKAAEGTIAPTVALAAMVRSAWQRPEVRERAMAAWQAIGEDRAAGEEALVAALAARAGDPDCDPEVRRAVVARLVEYSTKSRRSTYPYHYLHEPCLRALERMAHGMDDAAKGRLIDDLLDNCSGKGAPEEAVSRLCVKIDPLLASRRRGRGIMGQRIAGDLLHAAPHLFVADLDAEVRQVRTSAASRLRSYGVATEATHEEFARLLAKPKLQDASVVLECLARLQPPRTFVEVLRPWLLREPRAYEAFGAIRPTPQAAIAELLRAVPSGEDRTRVDAQRGRYLMHGLRKLGSEGAVHIPELLSLAERSPRQSVEIAEMLPYLGVAGVRALMVMDPESQMQSLGSAIARQMSDHVDVDTRIQMLGFLLSRGEAIEGLDRVAKEASRAQDPRVRSAAQLLSANLAPDSNEATEAMLRVLGGSNGRLRSYAIKALARKARQPRVRAFLSWLRFDDDEVVAKVAAEALR